MEEARAIPALVFDTDQVTASISNTVADDDARTNVVTQPKSSVEPLALPLESTLRPTVSVNKHVFRLCWVGFLLIHATVSINFAYAASAYLQMPGTVLSGVLQNQAVGMDIAHATTIAAVAALLATLHAVCVASMLVCSLYHRKFVFFIDDHQKEQLRRAAEASQRHASSSIRGGSRIPSCPWTRTRKSGAGKPREATGSASAPPKAGTLWVRSGHAWLAARCRAVYLLVRQNAQTFFLARKLAETLLQTYQTSRLTANIPRAALARIYVVLVVINCWSPALIRRRFARHRGAARLSALALDTFLDVVFTVLVPMAIAIPYASLYDPSITNFPTLQYFDDAWFSRMRSELRLVLVASWTDLASRVLLSLSVLLSVAEAKSILVVKSEQSHHIAVQPRAVRPDKIHATEEDKGMNVDSITVWLRAALSKRPSVTKALPRLLQLALFVVGLTVLAIHLEIEHKGTSTGCVLQVMPWLSSKPACTLVHLDCAANAITGTKAELSTVLSSLDERSLESLIIVQCPDLHMPAVIQRFAHLGQLKIIGSTITEWGPDAALTAQHHARISVFLAINVQVPGGELPMGLVDPHFPPNLKSITLAFTNINTLPASVATSWPRGMFLLWEASGITTFPDVLLKMVLPVLSLAGNQLPSLPLEAMYMPGLWILDLSGNPLTTLPEVSPSMIASRGPPWRALQRLTIQQTELDALPNWMARRGFECFATKSPVCASVAARNLTADQAFVGALADCTTWKGIGVVPHP